MITIITKDAALEDLKKVVVTDSVQVVVIKVAEILIKMLATIRSNQLLTEEEKKAIKAKQVADRASQQTQQQKQ